jgi:hypothetical protein
MTDSAWLRRRRGAPDGDGDLEEREVEEEDDEDNSLASNSSSSSSLMDSSLNTSSSSASRIEDVTEEEEDDGTEKRFRLMEESAGPPILGGAADPTGSGSGVEDTFTEREDEEFCEVSPRLRQQRKVVYAPDRPPPFMDFLTVITAFIVAVFAAYYTISLAEA